jgi:LPPG:FO 2-phospho-L-lactate transferase
MLVSLAHSGRRVTALAGGVGGAKLAQGLAGVVPGENLTVIVNTADDFELYGLNISPDLDTVIYTLAGIANPVFGWGVDGDTQVTLEAMKRLGENTWFQLGDQDFATHILRTHRLRRGDTLTAVAADFARALGIEARIVPMTDSPVATLVDTPTGRLGFQDYFVARHQTDDVTGVVFDGIEAATPSEGVLEAIHEADIVVINPSNPIVSIGPILSVPGVREALRTTSARRVGVSPIVGGKALKGPADKMLQTLGHEVSSLGIARIYAGLLDLLVIDEQDRDLHDAIEALGIHVLVTNSIMGDAKDRQRLAREILAATEALTGVVR